jgi:hypothetical protein
MDELLPQLGVALLLILLGLPLLVWFVLRFPSTTGALGLLTVVLELFRLLGEPGPSVRSSCGDFTPRSLATPPPADPGPDRGNGLRGPEVRL